MWQVLLVYAVPYLLIGYDVLGEAAEGIMEGDPFDEDFLMSLATVGALLIGFLPGAEPQFIEGVFVMLFFQLGELFEDYAEDKARDSISELMDIRPDVAFVSRNGKTEGVSPEEVHTGETVVVKPGEKIPLDGTILEGNSSLNTVALTGESLPRDVVAGMEVVSGCEDHPACRECRREQVAQRVVHPPLRTCLHACRGHCRPRTGVHPSVFL